MVETRIAPRYLVSKPGTIEFLGGVIPRFQDTRWLPGNIVATLLVVVGWAWFILNGSIAHYSRNVKRWRDGQMTLRWVASALSDAKDRFRKLRGYRDMKQLMAAPTKRFAETPPAELKAT